MSLVYHLRNSKGFVYRVWSNKVHKKACCTWMIHKILPITPNRQSSGWEGLKKPIPARNRHIESHGQHKNSLMQQLFPSEAA